MKRIELEFISEGFHELLCSDEVEQLVSDTSEKVAARATASSSSSQQKGSKKKEPAQFVVKGPKLGGYGGGRWIAYVSAENDEARRHAVFAHRLEKTIWEMNK